MTGSLITTKRFYNKCWGAEENNFGAPTFFANKESMELKSQVKWSCQTNHSKGDSTMLYKDYTQELIGFKDATVTFVERKDNSLHIHMIMKRKVHKCPRCGNDTDKIHDYRIQRIKDISSFGNYTIIHLRERRYVCPLCNKRFYEETLFLPRYQRITSRLIAFIINSFREITSIKNLSNMANVSPTTAIRIFDHIKYSNKSLPHVISMDEFRGNAGEEKFQCILTDPENKKVLDILPNRKGEDLYRYFSKFKDRHSVKYVVIDMSGPYRSLIKTVFPRAQIIADKYHVVRQVAWAFENVRKAEQKKFYEQRRKYFKRSRKLLLKRPDKLTAIEAEEVEAMLKISERLRQAYVLKNEFYKVMDSKNSLRLKSNWPDGTCYSTVTISLNSMTVSGPLQTGKERY
ncbi:MAG: ISL3 family transposase [Clostridiaceae bacterium]|jgi:transposase|nr:ISL3 family transposase [Clostridiaceae bacterium]